MAKKKDTDIQAGFDLFTTDFEETRNEDITVSENDLIHTDNQHLDISERAFDEVVVDDTLVEIIESKNSRGDSRKIWSSSSIHKTSDGLITVYETQITNKSQTHWLDLFQGFTKIKALTFSSSMGFLGKVLPLFQEAEVLFGSEHVLGNLNQVLAYQASSTKVLTESFHKYINLATMMDNGQLKFYLCNKANISHKKIYLLSDDSNDRYRVIYGSANLSKTAFEGNQGEIILTSDDPVTYNFLLDNYEETKALAYKALTINPQDLVQFSTTDFVEYAPIITTETDANVIEIRVDPQASKSDPVQEEQEYLGIQEDFVKDFKKMDIPSIERMADMTNSKRLLVLKKPKLIEQLIAPLRRFNLDEDKQGLPILKYNHIAHCIEYQEKVVDLQYDDEKVFNDIQIMMDIFHSYETIMQSGDVVDAQRKYFGILNYMFVAPFLSVAREYAYKFNSGINVHSFPMNLIVQGFKSSGKTWMLTDFIQQLMFPRGKFVIDTADATAQKLHAMRYTTAGFPLVVDDVDNNKWKDLRKKIKIETYKAFNISPVILTTNDVLNYEEEYQKRAIYLTLHTTTSTRNIIDRNMMVLDIQKLTGHLYKKYLAKMMALMDQYVDLLKDTDVEANQIDLLRISSDCLLAIIGESYRKEIPSYMTPLSLQWYLIENTEQSKKEILLKKYRINPQDFVIDGDILKVYFSDYKEVQTVGKLYDANMILTKSDSYNAKDYYIYFDYAQAKSYFGFNFKEPNVLKRWVKKLTN